MSQKEILGLHRITKKHLKELCKKHRLYQTPHLNDQLYLHYQGFQAIENLEEYTGLKCLWLESNAISEIQGLESLTELKCLFLQNNLISKIENLQCCPELDTLNLASNHITRIENCGVDVLPVLSTLNLSRNYLRNSGGLQELVNCKSLWSLDLANNRIDDILVVKIFASMPELRVLVLQGNPVVSQVPQYRKTLILECKNLTYLDSRPVFPKDRACAEAWKRGGYEEERKEHDRWIRLDRKKIRDSVNATLRLRQKHGDADVHLLESTDEEDETGHIKKKRKAILDKTTPDLEITGVDQSEESDRSPRTSNEVFDTTSAAMAESSTSLQAAGTFNSNEEEADDTLPELIQSDDMPAEKEDPKVSKSAEGFEEPQDESMEAQSDEKIVEVEEEKDATNTKLQSEEGSVEKLEDDGEKSIQQPADEVLIENEEVSPSEPGPVRPQNKDDSVEASTDVSKDADAKPVELDDDVEMEPDQDLIVSQDNERADSSGSEPNLQEVVQACIAKSSLYNPVLMNSGPAFSKEPAAWKRFNSSDSSSGSDISSSSDLSSDESDTSESEDVTISDKDTNIAEPKEDEELVANEEAATGETGVEVSDIGVTEVKTSVTSEPTEVAFEVLDDSEERKVMASVVIVEPSIPDQPTEGEMEASNREADYVKSAVDLAEPTEAVVDLPATERAGTEMEVADLAVNENASIPVDPSQTGIEPSSFAVEEVKDTMDDVADPNEPEIKEQGLKTGEVKTSVVIVEPSEMEEEEVKPSIPVEPNEVEMVPSNVEIAELKDSVEVADPTEAALKVTDFEAGEDQAAVVMVEPLEMETQEDKLSILAEPTEIEMEPSRIAVDEVKNTINDVEPNEPVIKEHEFEAGEVKTSDVAIEPSEMEVEKDKPRIPVESTEVEIELSNLEVAEVKNTIEVAGPTEIAVAGFKAGEVKTSVVDSSEMEEEEAKSSILVEPKEVEMEPSNLAVEEVKDHVDVVESTETVFLEQDFEESELKTSFATVEEGMEEDKPSIPVDATETEMETSSFATDEVSNSFSFANLTRSGTIDLFAMELTNDTLNDLYYDITSNPMEKVQKFKEETADNREHTVSQHVEVQDSTLEERETLSQSFQSDHDTLDTTNWSFTEPDDTMSESFKTSDETDTFDTDNCQEDSGLVNSFQTTCIGSDLENQDQATSLEDDSEELITPRPDESSAVALDGLDDILSQVCSEEEETPVRFEEPSHSQAYVEVEVIKKEEPLYVDDKPKAVEDPEVSSWLETFLTAVRKKEEKIRQTSIKEKTLDDIKEVDEDLTQMEAGSSTKPDTKNSTDKTGDQRPPAVEDKPLSEKNTGPAWLQDILKSLREKEEETEGDTTVIHKGEGLFSKIESLSEQLHLEQSNIEKLKETEAEKAWIRLQIEECVEDATSHSEGELKDEEASSNQYTDESSEEKCEGTGIDQFSEGLSTYAASLDADQRAKYRPHHLAVASTREEVSSPTAEPEPVVEESLTWWQQTLASAHTVKDSKPPVVPEEPTPPPTVEETELKRRFEEEFSENQTLEDKAEAFRLLETVLAATRKEEIESLLIEPEVKEVVHELLEEDTKSTSSSDSSYHEKPVDPEAKPALTLRQVLDSFNAIQETVALRTQQRSQRIKELIDNPLTKEFCAQSADDINRQVEEMKMDQRKRINDMIDKVYAQRDKYNDTLEVVNGRLMVVKRGTGALEEVPPPPKYNSCGVSTDQSGEPSSKYVSCGVSTSQMQDTFKLSSCGGSTDQTNNAPSKNSSGGGSEMQGTSKYSSCGSSTDQTNNAPSKYSSCGSSTDQTNNAPSKYSSCGVSSQTEDTHKNDSESDDYGTALSDEAANDDDDGDIEQHASDTKIKRIPYLFARCSTTSQSSSNISQEGDEEDTTHFECNNEQQYASLRKVQQLHKDIDEALFIKASKWMEDGVEIPPMQPPVLEKRKGKEEEMLLKNFLGPTIENNEIPAELYNELQSFMDFDEEALEDIASIFDTPDEGE